MFSMRRKKSFWEFKNKIAYSFLTIFLILLLLLTNGSFQAKGDGDPGRLDMERAYVGMVSREGNRTNTKYPMYLAPRENLSLIGVMPTAYGQWIAHLMRARAWRRSSHVFNQPLCYLPKWSSAQCGRCLVNFFMYLDSIKIRE